MVASILLDSLRRERVLSSCDASDILRDAFFQAEACMNHHYEVSPSVLCSHLTVWSKFHSFNICFFVSLHRVVLQQFFWFGLMVMRISLLNAQMLGIPPAF